MTSDQPGGVVPPAEVTRRRRISLVWLIPFVAAAIAVFLGYRTLSERGPLISVTFHAADGITTGQTEVRHKGVRLGTVDAVRLSDDMSHVAVQVRMDREAEAKLTDHAKFWVVRPRLGTGAISGLETLVSGSYIEMDPGLPGGKAARDFVGLEQPPGVRSDDPGRTFTVTAAQIGSLGAGSPVFYRDVPAGEVLGADTPGLDGNILIRVFVRSPFDKYVRGGSRFWNASGLRLETTGGGLHLELESVQALLLGGIAFDTPEVARNEPIAPANTEFNLYPSLEAATSATSKERVNFLVYFEESVQGLAVGGPVQLDGIRVGSVSDIKLEFDPEKRSYRVAVHLGVEPERISQAQGSPQQILSLLQDLVARGMRAQLQSTNLLTGEVAVGFDFFPGAPPAEVRQDGEYFVFPSQPSGLNSLLRSLNETIAKVNSLPLGQIATSLNDTLGAARGVVDSPDLKETLHQLPEISKALTLSLKRIDDLSVSLGRGFGANSDIRRNLDATIAQANDALRSVRMLADFLDRHPEALIRGRNGASE